MSKCVEAYLARMRGCAARMGRELEEISDRNRAVRLVESDARSVEAGFASGLLTIEPANRARTQDPHQGSVWVLEGDDPVQMSWEALPRLAAYVELVGELHYPVGAVRVQTSDHELGLDLAVLNEAGLVLVVGVAKAEPIMLAKLAALVPTFEGDPGWPRREAEARDAQRLAHQLWATQAPYLWLVAAGARRAFRVTFGRTVTLAPVKQLPSASVLWPYGFDGSAPRIALPPPAVAAG